MKLIKNIVRLLALITLSLSFSPLITVHAADAIQVNTKTYNALTGDTTTTAPDGTQTKTDGDPTSEVSVTVLSGILTLDAVPDFNFGTAMLGSTTKLKNNEVDSSKFGTTSTYGKDGNKSGILQMTDSRNLKDAEHMPGFQLTATMGKLQGTVGSNTAAIDATLCLSAMPLVDGENNNVSNSSTDIKTLPAEISSRTGSQANIINMAANSYNPGVIQTKFTTPDSASLKLGGTANPSEQSSKNMNAIITWNLSAAPSVTQ